MLGNSSTLGVLFQWLGFVSVNSSRETYLVECLLVRNLYSEKRNNYSFALAQMVVYLPLVQQVRGSITGVVVNFNLKIFNLGARWGGDVHFLIARLHITGLD